jgi:hypothetical protein
MIINVTSPIIIIKFSKITYYVYNNVKNISESFDIVIVFEFVVGVFNYDFFIHSKI